ncbi:NUDIX hydrolase [Chthonobacter rhizosphaerae]|uniref:NUDIX hydrolase n=1 Tax=Chthonobacter rhizosphaerae TaxID=2735553 RepID=UPI0015EF28EA|nr:NUDIX hydrolase [Chthonobacter rhizosphaerae]
MGKASKPILFEQVAALVHRRAPGGGLQILMVTTRETGRWILPRGWTIKGLKPHEAAETEAFEEAGVIGKADRKPFTVYRYIKRFPKKTAAVVVAVYPMTVERELDDWPEKGQRDVAWVTPEEAVARAGDPGLIPVITQFVDASAAEEIDRPTA